MNYFLNRRLAPLCFVLCSCAAQAQTTEVDGKATPAAAAFAVTANVAVASQYVSRGFRQTWGKPALQGGLDYAHSSGLSLGTWLSAVSNRFAENATLECDLYGGYTGAVGDIGYSGMLYYYKYPGAEYRATATKYDYGEVALGLTYRFLYAKYYYTVTKDFFGITHARGTGYLDAGANVDMGSGYTLLLHVGDGRVGGAGNGIWDWRDIKVGASKAFDGGWTATAAYTKAQGATNAYDDYTLGIPNAAGKVDTSSPGTGTVVVSLTKTF